MSISLRYKVALSLCLLIVTHVVSSQGMMTVNSGIGLVAANVTNNFTALTRFITAGSYLAGLAFFISAIMKFKQHKDNPTQIPIGTPIALVFIAAALLFLPGTLSSIGFTVFSSGGGSVAGPTGTVFQ